jgi:hypothetical protein
MATVVPLPVICELHVAPPQVGVPRATSQVIGHAAAPSSPRSTSATRRCSSGVGRSADRLQSMGYVIAVDHGSKLVDQRRCAFATPPGPWST